MDFKSKKAIYLQIADHIGESILRKEWAENEKIPSIREMAATLEVNPNTVTRTYAYLEERGIIKIQRGVGYFVAEQAVSLIVDLKKKEFFDEELPALFRLMELMNIDIKEIINLHNQTRKK